MLFFIFLIFCNDGHSWGLNGHRIIGEIAKSHLHQKTKLELKNLLGQQSLAEISNWADKIKSDSSWHNANYWHYLNIPKNKTYFEIEHHPKGDILRALYYFERILRNQKVQKTIRIQALKFLVHLIGDIHQPLHVGYKRDQGGNKVRLRWFGKKTNLHSLWDNYLIQHAKLSYTEYAKFINRFGRKEKRRWSSWGYLQWAYEAQNIRDSLYNVGGSASYRYYYQHVGLLNEQLRKGGLRLAFVLNQIFLKRRLTKDEREIRKKFAEMGGPFPEISHESN